MAKEEKPPTQKHSKPDSPAPQVRPAASPSQPKPAPAQPSKPGLTLQQKAALIGAAVIIALCLGVLLWPAPAQATDYDSFTHYIYNNSRSGLIMDGRGASGAGMRQQVMQCGVNFISGPFYAATGKDLLLYACDDSGCFSSEYRFDLPNSTPAVSNVSVPFSDALSAMRERAYIYIHAGAQDQILYHPTYMEVIVGSTSNVSNCQIGYRNLNAPAASTAAPVQSGPAPNGSLIPYNAVPSVHIPVPSSGGAGGPNQKKIFFVFDFFVFLAFALAVSQKRP